MAGDPIRDEKRALRSRVRAILKGLDPILRQQQGETIQGFVLESPWYKSCRRLCAYVSCERLREVETSRILCDFLDAPRNSDSDMQIPKKLYVPRVEDKQRNMKMLHITTISDLVANSMNILEPGLVDSSGEEREDVMRSDEPLDLLLLPGRRLGRGGGYYDCFIKTYLEIAVKRGWKPPLLVALAYSQQILDEAIPVSVHDVFIDALVSPSGVLPISAYAAAQMQK
eukprot:TRINITY_DN2976_c0_g1_i1.p1 TRINITY_DN2976_c0_g1~~TRINITY_DN2976_c0_g1_i1.p1  ORF type:complete len:266 (+),score=37.99 TRINITY_DN2976_c0_g1_i1:119-799(+)